MLILVSCGLQLIDLAKQKHEDEYDGLQPVLGNDRAALEEQKRLVEATCLIQCGVRLEYL